MAEGRPPAVLWYSGTEYYPCVNLVLDISLGISLLLGLTVPITFVFLSVNHLCRSGEEYRLSEYSV
jgi:hypothetical protein